jgi:hypothetical protein
MRWGGYQEALRIARAVAVLMLGASVTIFA